MNTVISFTPAQMINVVLSICAAIVSVSAAITIIIKLIDKAKQPQEKLESRITDLEHNLDKIEDRLKLGNRRFETDKAHIDAIEEANTVTSRALLAILSHAINGQDVDSLKAAKHDLEEYLTKGRIYDD